MGTLKVSGIYAIINKLNNKVYVGKSIDIKSRWSKHKADLSKGSKDANRHLKNAVNKYGIRNFYIEVLEEIDKDEGDEMFKERELFWMDYLNSCNRENGYNLRRDSSTKMIVHDETRELHRISTLGTKNPNYGNKWSDEQKYRMSEIQKERYRLGEATVNYEACSKGRENKFKSWEENPELKQLMAKRVSDKKSKYDILKIDRDSLEIIEEFDTFMNLKEKYPNVGKTVIFSVCNGHKKSYLGFLWRYRDKITKEIIEPK